MADPRPLPPASPSSGIARRVLIMLGRLLVGSVFVYAAYSKLHLNGQWHVRDYWYLFAMSINSYGVLPEWGVLWLARALPWVELALGLLLISGMGLRYISVVASLLLAGFFAVMLRAHFKGLEIDCGCFGPGEKLGARTLIRDGALLGVSLALTVAAFLVPQSKRSL